MFRSPYFYVDVIATFPTLVTNYNVYGYYYLKFLRYLDFNRVSNIVGSFGNYINSSTNFKKDSIFKT